MSKKNELLARHRKDTAAIGLEIAADGMICTLCWSEASAADTRIEHFVPGSVGGNRCVLTCRHCNNTQGTLLDSQVAAFAHAADVSRGVGDLPIEVIAGDIRAAANLRLELNSDPPRVSFDIVGKASNWNHPGPSPEPDTRTAAALSSPM